jgi:hypothetical protein
LKPPVKLHAILMNEIKNHSRSELRKINTRETMGGTTIQEKKIFSIIPFEEVFNIYVPLCES